MRRASHVRSIREHRDRFRRFFVMVVWGVGGFVVCLGLAWVVLRSDVLSIRAVHVVGAHTTSSDEIVTALRSFVSRNTFWGRIFGPDFLLAWPSRVDPALLHLFSLNSVVLDRAIFSREITVAVSERVARGVWCVSKEGQDSCWSFDADGMLFRRGVAMEGGLARTVRDETGRPLLLGSRVLSGVALEHFFGILSVLDRASIATSRLVLPELSLEEIHAKTYTGATIFFSLRFSPESVLPVLSGLVRNPGLRMLEYIDFRIEKRAYYK